MKTLLAESYAPSTSVLSFVNAHFDAVANALWAWRSRLYPDEMRRTALSERMPEVLHRLEPLTSNAHGRELLLDSSGWVAYLNCSRVGSDAFPAVSYLSRRLAARAVIVTTIPHEYGRGRPRSRSGSVQFSLYGPDAPGDWQNRVRAVGVHFEDRWEFFEDGVVQPYEESWRYANPRIRDRLTSDMVERYCQALGIDVFDPASYGPRAELIERIGGSPRVEMSLQEARKWLGIS